MSTKKRLATFCIACGHARVVDGECGYCMSKEAGLDALKAISTFPTITLRCPGVTPKRRLRCGGKFTVSQTAFEPIIGVAGNGPGAYLLSCRHRLSHRCERCDQWFTDKQWIDANMDAISAFVAAHITKEPSRD